ncbi:putative periplasmic serine endoprotease DegP-like [Methylacidimicrobium sp. AP8]|uniref:Do family serine endopeptidase n=1 Tax=Methylacidimicrobium sp. AP8 TaxID=2730359 RepID=UPI0018C0E7E1|nr:Do family serine endopeptidase [Methylacidimicrobium sp. AP8]CAB4244193.1 putative periplasmic serine endoprotease DegP-like [Methylacidimicrobium sp. AP8]
MKAPRLAGASLLLFAFFHFFFPVRSPAAVQLLTLAAPSKQSKENSFSIQVDDASLSRQGVGLVTSFAPVVKKVVPSVVQITTTQRVKAPEGWPFPFPPFPFFNEPPFRRFFGPPDGEDQGGRRQAPSQPPRSRRQSGLGSGVIISPDGYILTNNHVVEVAEEIKVLLGEVKKEYAAKVVGKDPYSDIALVKIDAKDLPAAVFTDSDKVEVGDIVLAIGNPFALSQTVTMGIVSGKGRKDIGIEEYEDFIQTDAAINPGNSGGALVDVEGRLVGINTAIVSPGRVGNLGIGFAVPSNMARKVMQELVTHGRVIRGFLGVTISEVTPELARAFKLPEPYGALVEQVTPGAPAAQAGIKDGDVIIGFNGQKVVDPRAFRLAVSETPPGTKITLKIWRDGKELTVQTVLKERPNEPLAGGGAPGGEQGAFLPGVEIADLNSATRQQLEIPSEVQGVVVTNVDQDSPAGRPGRNQLQPGDVILQVNHRAVHNVREAQEAANASQGDVLLQVWSHGMTRFVVVKR